MKTKTSTKQYKKPKISFAEKVRLLNEPPNKPAEECVESIGKQPDLKIENNAQIMVTNQQTVIMKTCVICAKTLPKNDFPKNGSGGVRLQCKICWRAAQKTINNPPKEESKFCPGCETILDWKDFDLQKSAYDGLQSSCKKCKKKQKLARLNTFDGFMINLFKDLRDNAKKRKIDVHITLKDIMDLYKQQNGTCALSKIKLTYVATERQTDSEHILNKWNISVDRKKSGKPYTNNNIQLVCAIINRMKMDTSNDYFITICGSISRFNTSEIDKLLLKDDDGNCIVNISKRPSSTSIPSLFDEIQNKQIIVMETAMQKWACSLKGYTTKTFGTCRDNAISRKLSFEITKTDIENLYQQQNGICKLSGIHLTYIGYQKDKQQKINNWNISIDRCESSEGYTKKNIQLVCAIVNIMKSDMSNSQFLLLCDKIYKSNFRDVDTFIIKTLIPQIT